MTNKTSTTAPTPIVWFVPERDGAPWSRIEALWPTKNGAGFRRHRERMPVASGTTVILPNDSRESGQGGKAHNAPSSLPHLHAITE